MSPLATTLPTHEELGHMLDEMKAAKNLFYSIALQIGVHRFVEFAGLMNEYILACEALHAKNVDFVMNTPSFSLENIDYIREKLTCIFEDALATAPGPAARDAAVD